MQKQFQQIINDWKVRFEILSFNFSTVPQIKLLDCQITLLLQCTVVFSSSKSGTLNPALNGIYLLMRHMDHYQIFTRPGTQSDLGIVQILLRSVGRIKRYRQLSAGLSVLSKHHSAMMCSHITWHLFYTETNTVFLLHNILHIQQTKLSSGHRVSLDYPDNV